MKKCPTCNQVIPQPVPIDTGKVRDLADYLVHHNDVIKEYRIENQTVDPSNTETHVIFSTVKGHTAAATLSPLKVNAYVGIESYCQAEFIKVIEQLHKAEGL